MPVLSVTSTQESPENVKPSMPVPAARGAAMGAVAIAADGAVFDLRSGAIDAVVCVVNELVAVIGFIIY